MVAGTADFVAMSSIGTVALVKFLCLANSSSSGPVPPAITIETLLLHCSAKVERSLGRPLACLVCRIQICFSQERISSASARLVWDPPSVSGCLSLRTLQSWCSAGKLKVSTNLLAGVKYVARRAGAIMLVDLGLFSSLVTTTHS